MPTPTNKTIRYFGDYVLFGQIAEGAMGEVWYARQESLNRPVAIKLIRAGTLATPADVERFRVEAQAAARLSHKHIVQVYEVGEHEGRHFFSMELIEGSSLATQIKEGGWRFDSSNARERQRAVVRLLVTVAHAVHHAHQRGVLHRDIKPANILIDEQGEPHLSDFGLAKLLDAEDSLTRSGAVLGTLSYMSPEQATGQSAQATTVSDIYSLGAVLYELLAGQPPFRGDNVVEVLRKVVEEEPTRPSRITNDELRMTHGKGGSRVNRKSKIENPIDRDLETLCLKCLEKAPSRRYATAGALAEDLERWLRGEPIWARPVSDAERAWKWVRRHPVTAGLSAMIAATVLMGLGTTTWQWHRAERQRALTAEAHARLQVQRAEELFGSEKAHLALPVLARVLRDDPGHRVAQERLVNALNQRGFLAPVAASGQVSPPVLQLALRVALSPDGTRVATATNTEAVSIQLWDARSGSLLHTIGQAHANVIRTLAFSPDGKRLVSSSADASAKIWNATLGSGITLAHPSAVHCAEFSPDGGRVLTAGRDGVARLWNAQTGELLLALPPERVALNTARFHPDGSRFATGADDGTVQLWILRGTGVDRFTEPFASSNAVWHLDFRTNTLAITLDDGATHTLTWTHPAGTLFPAAPGSAGLPAGGLRVDSLAGKDASAPRFPQPIATVLGRPAAQFHSAAITSVDTGPDGLLVATASLDKTARLWNARTRAPVTEPLVHGAPVNCVRFSSDGLRLATSTPGRVARVWDARTGQPLTDWIVFEVPFSSVTFSADGFRLEGSSGEARPIHCALQPAPLWLPELAEALGGSRLDPMGRASAPTPFAAIRTRLTRSGETNSLALWVKLLLEGPPP